MSSRIKRIWNAATTVLVALIAVLAALLWGVRLIGMQVFVVQSGSMEPVHRVGSLVYVKETDPAQLKSGDVITFELSGGLKGTHRIVEVIEDGASVRFRTKGDANEHADNNLIAPEDVVGRVVFSIPQLGYLVAFIQQPPGSYLAMSAIALVLLLIVLPDLLFDTKKPKKQEESQ